jgi:hypothetical protein
MASSARRFSSEMTEVSALFSGYAVDRNGSTFLVREGVPTPCRIPGASRLEPGFYSLDMADLSQDDDVGTNDEELRMPALFKPGQHVRSTIGGSWQFVCYKSGYAVCRAAGPTTGKPVIKAFKPGDLKVVGAVTRAVVPRPASRPAVKATSSKADRIARAKKIRAQAKAFMLVHWNDRERGPGS